MEVEQTPDGKAAVFDATSTDALKLRHVQLLVQAALLQIVGAVPSSQRHKVHLTWDGHDYLDAIRDQGIWEKTKDAVAETGGSVTLEIIRSLATGLLKKKIEKHTGITL